VRSEPEIPRIHPWGSVKETHFVYEEKKLISVLNSMDLPQWRVDRPDFLLTEG
jgi:hypothetical protein